MNESDHYQQDEPADVTGFTMDPRGCTDKDDGLGCKVLETKDGKAVKVLIHLAIANVTKHIAIGSPAYRQAYSMVETDYERRIHMLPEADVTELSLEQEKTRDAVIVTWQIERSEGGWEITSTRVWEGTFHSLAALNYKQGNALLRNRQARRLRLSDDSLKRVKRDMKLLKQFFLTDKKRKSAQQRVKQVHRNNLGYLLIQSAAVEGNKTISRYLSQQGSNQLFRNHAGVTVQFGDTGLLQLVSDYNSYSAHESHLIDRNFRANYGIVCKGHHGLKTEQYVHSTSPIRRYPDMIIHYLLRARLNNTDCLFDDTDLLRGHARHCNAELRRREENKLQISGDRLIASLNEYVEHVEKLPVCPRNEFTLLLGAYVKLPKGQRNTTFARKMRYEIEMRIKKNELRDIDYSTLLFLTNNWESLVQLALKGIEKNKRQNRIRKYLNRFLSQVKLGKVDLKKLSDNSYMAQIQVTFKGRKPFYVRTDPTISSRRAKMLVSTNTIKALLQKSAA